MPEPAYYLGCAQWATPGWVGSLFSTKNRDRWLTEYSQVFNTVEGNTVFYGLPTRETVQRWAREVTPGFQFSLKFPKTISHERQLVAAERETAEFLDRLAILHEANHLGPSFLQLPPHFSGRHFDRLEAYLRGLPTEFLYSVDVRHLDYFDNGGFETQLNALLQKLNIDRVLFETEPLFSAEPADEHEVHAQGRKPKVPSRSTTTGSRPFLRFVGRTDLTKIERWIERWTEETAKWIKQGDTPYVFLHSPNKADSAIFAEVFHHKLQARIPELPDLPEWPGRSIPQQTSLF